MKWLIGLFAALSLSACATVGASIPNPLGAGQLTTIESAYGVALSAAVAYKQLCVNRTIPPSCRTIVVQMQNAAYKAQGAIVAARGVAKNPTLNAISAIAAAQQALADFQAVQNANGVH